MGKCSKFTEIEVTMLTEIVHKLVRGNYFIKVYIFYGKFKYVFTVVNYFRLHINKKCEYTEIFRAANKTLYHDGKAKKLFEI